MKKKPKEEKQKNTYLCPHCNKEIFPAQMMAEISNRKHPKTSEHMKKVVEARWNRIKLYGR